MANKDKNGLLGRWLSGDLRHSETAPLEKDAAADPFLADALEGYQSFPQSDHLQRLALLQKRLEQRTEQKKSAIVVWLPRIAAAAVVVIVGIIALRFFLTPTISPENIAQLDQPTTEAIEKLGDSIIEKKEEDLGAPPTLALNDVKKEPRKEQNVITKTTESSKNDLAVEAPATSAGESGEAPPTLAETRDAQPITAPPAPENAPSLSKIKPAEREETAKPSIGKANYAPTVTEIRTRSASTVSSTELTETKLVDANGKPLIGVAVVIPSMNVATFTDMDGVFFYNASKTKRLAGEFFSDDGTSQVIVFNNDADELQLDPESPFAKRHSSKSKKRIDRKGAPVFPQPVGGIAALQTYLDKNINANNSTAGPKAVTGSVTLSFEIDEKGVPKDFKTLKAIGDACEEAAINAIKNGPRWISSTPKVRIIYSVWCKRS
jgi:hypothetical protein